MQYLPLATNASLVAAGPGQGSDSQSAAAKESKLRHLMLEMGRVLVAYSGGVDSAYLAHIANQELGDQALCVLGLSPSVSDFQRRQALETAGTLGLDLVTVATDELSDPHYSANPANRCYFCKSELYDKLRVMARDRDIAFLLDGTNADDVKDVRPGRLAASEREVLSPLAEVGLTKSEIRDLSRAAGLPDWEKPASPCLASRVAYGVPVTIERLSKVEAAEQVIRDLGFREFRVRVHSDLARVEISPSEIGNALNRDFADHVSQRLSEIGFKYVTLDLKGFRSGSLN